MEILLKYLFSKALLKKKFGYCQALIQSFPNSIFSNEYHFKFDYFVLKHFEKRKYFISISLQKLGRLIDNKIIYLSMNEYKLNAGLLSRDVFFQLKLPVKFMRLV